MKRKYAIRDVLNEIDLATANSVDVRTSGGDIDIDPPEVILEWRTRSLRNHNGANALGGFTDDGAGTQTGREYHRYYRMQVNCIIRSYDEVEAHDILTTIQNAFSQYEYDATLFHDDTAEWDIGDLSPRNNPVVEPDWYEITVSLGFDIVEKSTETVDAIDTIQKEDTDDYIDLTLEDGDVSVGD